MRTLDLRNSLFEVNLPSIESSMIEVTRLSRPDHGWKFIDVQGHEHKWRGSQLPTLTEVVDIEAVMGCDEEGEFEEIPPYTHYECSRCGERVSPGYTSDNEVQYIPGLKRYPDIEIIPKSEKMQELMEIFTTGETCLFLLMDGIGPIPGKVLTVQTSVNDYIRATIRRTT